MIITLPSFLFAKTKYYFTSKPPINISSESKDLDHHKKVVPPYKHNFELSLSKTYLTQVIAH